MPPIRRYNRLAYLARLGAVLAAQPMYPWAIPIDIGKSDPSFETELFSSSNMPPDTGTHRGCSLSRISRKKVGKCPTMCHLTMSQHTEIVQCGCLKWYSDTRHQKKVAKTVKRKLKRKSAFSYATEQWKMIPKQLRTNQKIRNRDAKAFGVSPRLFTRKSSYNNRLQRMQTLIVRIALLVKSCAPRGEIISPWYNKLLLYPMPNNFCQLLPKVRQAIAKLRTVLPRSPLMVDLGQRPEYSTLCRKSTRVDYDESSESSSESE